MKLSDGKDFYLLPMLPRQYSARERARIRAKEWMILCGESEQKSKHGSSDKTSE